MSWAHPAEAAAPGARPPTRPEDGVYAENGTWYPPGVPLPRGHRPACLSGVCRYWQAGRCARGAGCPYRHPPPILLAGPGPARRPHSGTLLTTAMPPSDTGTEVLWDDLSDKDTLLSKEELDALRDKWGKLPGEYPPQHVPNPAYTAAPFICRVSRSTSQSPPSSAEAASRLAEPSPLQSEGAGLPQGSPLKGTPPPRPPQQRGAACGGVRRQPPPPLESPQCSPRLLGKSSRQGSPTLTLYEQSIPDYAVVAGAGAATSSGAASPPCWGPRAAGNWVRHTSEPSDDYSGPQIVTDSSSVSPRPGGHAACGHAPRQEQLATPGQGPCVASAAAAEPDFLSQVRQLQGQFAQMQEQLSAIPRLEQRVAMLETENTALRQTVEALRQQSYAVPGAAGAAAGPPQSATRPARVPTDLYP
eukprot:TRINITY_DN18130_c0_g1_i4.p1 TRINITY_DN18130_c0_g1~~TRINITY_DN18130_c0_g1_i4.p1  ORF type:complete len:442 (+),score=67.38 TRINITY_DN18130_c0_g1_i4:80-1327(+)